MKSARNKLRIGVIGAGVWGGLHARKIVRIEKAVLAGVLDADRERACRLAGALRVAVFKDLAEAATRCDALIVATPPVSHYKIANRLLAEGRHLLVEKPLALRLSAARKLCAEARRQDLVLATGFQERLNPVVEAVKRRCARPLLMEVERLGPFPGRSLDADVILDVMIHDVDLALLLGGSEPIAVRAAGVAVVSGKPDIADARIEFANGFVAKLSASRISGERRRRLRLFHGGGYLSADFLSSVLKTVEVEKGPQGVSMKSGSLDLPQRDALFEQDRLFVLAALGRGAPAASGEDGVRALDLAEKIRAAMMRQLRRAAG